MAEYKMLRDLVLGLPNVQLHEAPRASDTELLLAHDASYVQRVISGTLSKTRAAIAASLKTQKPDPLFR